MANLTDRIRTWFERTPKAQKAYRRLSRDLDTVVGRVESKTGGLRERITPIIDPVVLPRPGAPAEPDDAPPPNDSPDRTP